MLHVKRVLFWAVLLIVTILIGSSAISESVYIVDMVRFGMNPEEVIVLEKENGHDPQSADLYNSMYDLQLYYEDAVFYSLRCMRMEYDFTKEEKELYQYYYVGKGGDADFLYMQSIVSAKYGNPIITGTESKIPDVCSMKYKDVTHSSDTNRAFWHLDDQKMGIDLWSNDTATVFLVFYDLSSDLKGDSSYYDPVSGIQFVIPENWVINDNLYKEDMIKLTLSPSGTFMTLFQYGCVDVWESYEGDETAKTLDGINSRSDVDKQFDENVACSMIGDAKLLKQETRNIDGCDIYIVYALHDDNVEVVTAVFCKNAYFHMFQFYSIDNFDKYIEEFNQIIDSITVITDIGTQSLQAEDDSFEITDLHNDKVTTLRDWFGYLDINAYINEPAGLSCTIGDWLFYGQADILSLTEGLEEVDLDLEIHEALNKTEGKAAVVMLAMSTDTMKNVTLSIMDITDFMDDISATGLKGQIDTMKEDTIAYFTSLGVENIICETIEKEIGGETFYGLEFSCTYQGMLIYQREIATMRGDIMLMLTATCYKTDETESVINSFTSIN